MKFYKARARALIRKTVLADSYGSAFTPSYLKAKGGSLYVVISIGGNRGGEYVAEVNAEATFADAKALFDQHYLIFGGANVCLASRKVLDFETDVGELTLQPVHQS